MLRRIIKSRLFRECTIVAGVVLAFVAFGGGGGNAVTNGKGTATPLFPRFAYVANGSDGTISIFAVDAETGQLRANGYFFAGGHHPTSVTVAPSGRFAYAVNPDTRAVAGFSIQPNNGALRPLESVSVGNQPVALTIDPSGKFAYVANSGSDDVSAFSVNNATGVLIPVPCEAPACKEGRFPTTLKPRSVVVEPQGRFAYVVGADAVATYRINVSGALLPAGEVATGGSSSLVVDHAGRFAYVPSAASNRIAIYAIDPETGVLHHVSAIESKISPVSIALDKSGRFAYVANSGNGRISVYAVDAGSGFLKAAGEAVAGKTPVYLVVDPSGHFLYALDAGTKKVLAFSIDGSTGALKSAGAMQSRHAGLVMADSAMAVVGGMTAVTYTPKFVYAAENGDRMIATFAVDTTAGTLTRVGKPVPTGNNPNSMVVDPSGRFAFVVNSGDRNVSVFSINQGTGELKNIGTVDAGISAQSVPLSATFDPSGHFAFVANHISNELITYILDGANGELVSAGKPVMTGAGPTSIAVDPTSRFVFVANFISGDISAFTVNPSNGMLKSVGDALPVGTNPCAIAVDPSGRLAFAANFTSNDISVLRIHPVTGDLELIATVPAGVNPASVTVDPSGRHLYVANSGSGDVSAFAIDGDSGTLNPVRCEGGEGCNGGNFLAGTNPQSISVDVSGRFVYVANFTSNAVTTYSITTDTGVLVSAGGEAATQGSAPISLATAGSIQ
jgi:6-phosphogluconolactonase (cycloisomerase 2 family)